MRMPGAENTQHEIPARPTGHIATREVLLGNSFQAAEQGNMTATEQEQHRTCRRRFIAGTQRCSSPPRSQDARGRRVSQHTPGRTRGRNDRTSTPLVRASALHGVSSTETFGRGSHLGSTLNPGRAVLTGGVFRRSGSVACIRADASPSEVLAPTIIDTKPGAVKPINAFSTLRYALPLLTVKFSVLPFK
jgi:hypothetical protein